MAGEAKEYESSKCRMITAIANPPGQCHKVFLPHGGAVLFVHKQKTLTFLSPAHA